MHNQPLQESQSIVSYGVDYGVDSIWSSMGYAAWCLWFIFELARFLRWASSIDLWRVVPYCVLWCIWQERNSRCFKGKERSISEFKSLLLHTLLEWSYSFNLFPHSNFLEMLDLCNLCVWCTIIHVHPWCTWTFD